jgi:DAK2 domain fusion protein YloV
VLEAARDQAVDALARTPEMLPVLKQAGVVDAGGSGFLLLLDVALDVVDGRGVPEPAVLADEGPIVGHGEKPATEHGVADLRYEVMYFLEADDSAVPAFKDVWAGIGDSIVVVGGDGIWNCHIHTDDIGASIEAGIDAGRPKQIRVTDLFEQVEELEEERWVTEGVASGGGVDEPPHVNEPVTTAVVAVAVGEGIKRIFHSLGVQRVVTGGQTMNPSTADLVAAVEACPADRVVILPNNKNIIPVAEQVGGQTTKQVAVVPTRGVTEAFAALLAYDPEADLDGNASSMTEAAGSVIAGEVTQAVRASSSDAGAIAAGDWLGLSRSGIEVIDADLASVCTALLDRLLAEGHEIVTLIEGEGASAAVTRRITEWLGDRGGGVEAEIHHGGQPLYPYLFGVE